MFKLSFNNISNFFKKAEKKVAEEAKRPVHKTDIKTTEDGVVKFQRMYTDANGKSRFFTVETSVLEDGTKQTKTKVQCVMDDGSLYTFCDEGVRTNRTKKVKREKGGSILGGDKVTIEKEYQDTMAESGRTEKMIKDFDEKNQLQHKDYTIKYRHWDRAKHGTQDRVYSEAPLNHSAKDISEVHPTEHKDYKHSWNGHSNYHYFKDGGESKYSKAVAAQEQARINAAKAAEEAKIAAEKAQAEYEKTLPLVNTGKALNKDIKDFKRVETTLPDGSVERKYFEEGKENPTIITKDKGILHQEWIHGGKTDFLYIKKVGKEVPYMIGKKDGYTFVSHPCKSGGLFERQYKHDGIIGYEGTEYGGTIKIPYNETQHYKKSDPSIQAYYDKQAKDYDSSKIWYQTTYDHSSKGPEVVEAYANAKESYIKLYDLITPYEK